MVSWKAVLISPPQGQRLTHAEHWAAALLCRQEVYIPFCCFIKFIMNVNYWCGTTWLSGESMSSINAERSPDVSTHSPDMTWLTLMTASDSCRGKLFVSSVFLCIISRHVEENMQPMAWEMCISIVVDALNQTCDNKYLICCMDRCCWTEILICRGNEQNCLGIWSLSRSIVPGKRLTKALLCE